MCSSSKACRGSFSVNEITPAGELEVGILVHVGKNTAEQTASLVVRVTTLQDDSRCGLYNASASRLSCFNRTLPTGPNHGPTAPRNCGEVHGTGVVIYKCEHLQPCCLTHGFSLSFLLTQHHFKATARCHKILEV